MCTTTNLSFLGFRCSAPGSSPTSLVHLGSAGYFISGILTDEGVVEFSEFWAAGAQSSALMALVQCNFYVVCENPPAEGSPFPLNHPPPGITYIISVSFLCRRNFICILSYRRERWHLLVSALSLRLFSFQKHFSYYCFKSWFQRCFSNTTLDLS